jgi:hypothetical protein
MAEDLAGPVGLRNRTQPVASLRSDQEKIIRLLGEIGPFDGGKKGLWQTPPTPGGDRDCPKVLADAIWDFQMTWKIRGEFSVIDGVVDPKGRSITKMNALVPTGRDLPVGPNGIDPSVTRINGMAFRQTNPEVLTAKHKVTNPVILPLTLGNKLQQVDLEADVQEYLFEITKDGNTFWVGACVPPACIDFTRVQVFFHPTVINGGIVHAADSDYRLFKGGWSGSIQRYVAMMGGQLARARVMTMIVPFMTMASASGSPQADMFADRPAETINAIMAAIQRENMPAVPLSDPVVTAVGASSFSSGIIYLRKFIGQMTSSGLLKEVHDFDSAFIKKEAKMVPVAQGAVCRLVTQVAPVVKGPPPPGWIALTPGMWSNCRAHGRNVHAQVGWMSYYSMMLGSAIL